jgi:hypothetical protein
VAFTTGIGQVNRLERTDRGWAHFYGFPKRELRWSKPLPSMALPESAYLEGPELIVLTIKTGEKPEVVGLPKDRNVWYFGKFKDGDEEVWFVIHTPSREVRGWTETDCMVNMGPADNLTPKHVSDVATFRDGGSATIEVYDYKGWGKRTFDFPFQTFNEEGKPNVWTFDKMPVWEYTHRHTPDGVNGLTWEEWKKIERR